MNQTIPAKPDIEYVVDLSDYRNQQVDLEIGGNRIIGWIPEGEDEPEPIRVTFRGTDNILFLEKRDNSRIGETDIRFEGSRGLVYLSQNVHKYLFSAVIEEDGICWFGRDVYMHQSESGRLHIRVCRGHAVALGYDCLLSTMINIDTAGEDTGGDVRIGNHVWIGQDVTIEGPSEVEANAVLGAGLKIHGQHLSANAIWIMEDGIPKNARGNIVFGKNSLRNRVKEEQKLYREIHKLYLGEMLKLGTWDSAELIADAKRASGMEERLAVFIKEADTREYVKPKFRRTYIEPLKIPVYGNNIIYGKYTNTEGDVNITFEGKGNVLIFEKGVKLGNCLIEFSGNGSLIFLSKSRTPISATISVGSEANLYLGKNCTVEGNPVPVLQTTESQTLFIGNNCKIPSGVWFRTSDQHPIFDVKSRKRINKAKSIFIGDGEEIPPGKLVRKGQKAGKMRGVFRRPYLYEKCFEALRNASDMDERIQWMLTLNNSDGLSRVLHRFHLKRNELGTRTVIAEDEEQ